MAGAAALVDQRAVEELLPAIQRPGDERQVLGIDLGTEDLADVHAADLRGVEPEVVDVGVVGDHVAALDVPVGDQRGQLVQHAAEQSDISVLA